MSSLTWSDSLQLHQPQMDQTHREFVELLSRVEDALGADNDTIATRLAEFAQHTEAHFAQEERWMATIGFAPENCHSFQHRQVLEVVREVQRRIGTEGDKAILSNLVAGLAEWFPGHAQMMDQALAETMTLVGLDPNTLGMSRPPHRDNATRTTCGSPECR